MQRSLFNPESSADTPPAPDAAASAGALAGLNPAQREAVCAPAGPILVIAGAGSGKTRTLVHRLAYLVEQGLPPENLLLLTFTRKAAQEMIVRAGRLLAHASCRQITGGTFHATANLILRRYAAHIGYRANFTILDQSDAEGIVNLLKSSLGLGGAGRRFPSRRLLLGIISKAVNTETGIADLVESQYLHLLEFLDDILLIAEHYQQFKLSHGLMDYDDLLVHWRRLLRENQDVRAELARRFQVLLVDEYQDTNPVQAEIVRLLAAPRNDVMAVGDDAQSIYSFRGADFRNIMEFPRQFPGTRVIRLEENYRSTPEILQVSNAIIAPAPEQYRKNLFSQLAGGGRPVLCAARNEGAQARFVVEKIRELQVSGLPEEEIAVLFRSGFHSYKLELELTAAGIDFEKRGGLKLTESAHIKDVLAHFRVLCNPVDRLSWHRLLLLIDKIGPKTAGNIIDRFPAVAATADGEEGASAEAEETSQPLAAHLQVLADYPAGKGWRDGLGRLRELLDDLQAAGSPPLTLLELVLAYYQPIFQRLYPDDYPRRQRDLEQLRPLLAGYQDIRDFLADTALDPPTPNAGEAEGLPPRLVLSTVHSAKGLEWDSVFIIHLAEGKFPAGQAEDDDQYEEERRLFYVAATRAKRNLYLLYPREVTGMDRRPALCHPSPFLAEVPSRLLELAGSARPVASAADYQERELFRPRNVGTTTGGGDDAVAPSAAAGQPLAVGARVRHPFFGPGVVVKMVAPRTVDVRFDRHGFKTLHLDYAKLESL
ncbi:ATP-dependent helicase [Desulfurivibrio dismutans]|uniref:ATP-dependent helicase n=1 Tax=Desulfurivibrio dismutans TaxID=1398908 RepID=UPI0023DC5B53|nr:ATP-dependent helicase [Desulfurivibrio alkaliphilus]MDF1613646.1 ATP-dependent helicase [Desulfurivibrio alkaliphilus]